MGDAAGVGICQSRGVSCPSLVSTQGTERQAWWQKRPGLDWANGPLARGRWSWDKSPDPRRDAWLGGAVAVWAAAGLAPGSARCPGWASPGSLVRVTQLRSKSGELLMPLTKRASRDPLTCTHPLGPASGLLLREPGAPRALLPLLAPCQGKGGTVQTLPPPLRAGASEQRPPLTTGRGRGSSPLVGERISVWDSGEGN